MQDKRDKIEDDDIDNEFIKLKESKRSKSNISSFILLSIITTIGVLLALGLSFSAIKLMDSNETINTLISSTTGDDNTDKYIITYVESIGDLDGTGKAINAGSVYISNATFLSSENGGSGEVVYFGGLLLTTKTTFENADSKITYEVTLTNSTKTSKIFYGLNFNSDGNVKYSISGIKEGDVIGPGKSVKTYITVEYVGNDDNNDNQFPKTIESSTEYTFEAKERSLHIEKAEFYKATNGGEGKVVYYGGMMLSTNTTLTRENSVVMYKITLKNDSAEVKNYNGLNYNKDSNVKYTVSGIKEGDTINPGSSIVIYLKVEGTSETTYPTTIETSVEFDFSDFGVSSNKTGIYLTNQFPISDEAGKQFQGTNYVFSFSLVVGSKTEGVYYELTAVPDKTNTLDPNYVKVYLEKNNVGVDLSYRKDGRVKVFTEYSNSENGAEGKVIYKGYVTKEDAAAGKINFVMRMWITEDLHLTDDKLADYVNRVFTAKVNTYATVDKKQ